MRKAACFVLIVILIICSGALPAFARGSHGHFRGSHGHFRGGVWIGPVWNPWWGPFTYPYPYVYDEPEVIVEQEPYIDETTELQPEVQYYWYFCKNPKGYYPYVQRCPDGWMKVLPSPPDGKE